MRLNNLFFCGRIRAYEAGDVDKGTVFEIPVTVVQPIQLDVTTNWRYNFDAVTCRPNTILRHFISVPNNATWAGKLILMASPLKNYSPEHFSINIFSAPPTLARYDQINSGKIFDSYNANCAAQIL